jgi:hypothetical protein
MTHQRNGGAHARYFIGVRRGPYSLPADMPNNLVDLGMQQRLATVECTGSGTVGFHF